MNLTQIELLLTLVGTALMFVSTVITILNFVEHKRRKKQ